MNDDADWQQWLGELRRQLRQANERRLLWLAGDAEWGRAKALDALPSRPHASTLWIGRERVPGLHTCDLRQAVRQLGAEYDSVVFDAHLGFCPDAFGAVAGTLRGGGLLLLLSPVASDWPDYDDPRRTAYAAWPHAAADVGGRYLTRLSAVLDGHPGALCVEPQRPLPALAAPSPAGTASTGDFGDCLNAEQQTAVAALHRVARGHPRRPLLLIADRGRGKSAALGIAAGQLLGGAAALRIWVTAPRRAAVGTLFAHAERCFDGPPSALRARLRFAAATEIESLLQPGELLLVDEAAGLPVAVLERLTRRCTRLALATTQHGYEGAGRGFAVRFSRLLDRLRPQRRVLQLDVPVRWRSGDPLEALINEALLLAAELPVPPSAAAGAVTVEPVDRDRLAADEPLLRATVALLVAAHYQTRPHDLRLLLDAPGHVLWLARCQGVPVGAAWLACEGGLEPDLAAAVSRSERRLRGNLLPQTLALHLAEPEAAVLRYGRLQRIVVHPDWRRQGIGLRLLDTATAWAADAGLDGVGSSFGIAAGLLSFWRRAGYVTVRLGDRVDPASGVRSVQVLRALRPPAAALLAEWRQRFDAELPAALSDANRLRDLAPELATALLAGAAGTPQPAQRDVAELRAFGAGQRSLRDSLPVLRRAWRAQLATRGVAGLPDLDRDLAVRVLLQGQFVDEVAKSLGLGNRAAAVERLRRLELDWISVQL